MLRAGFAAVGGEAVVMKQNDHGLSKGRGGEIRRSLKTTYNHLKNARCK
jgi:hypothetical protein